jgi:Mn-dependent DtxR family transcriptional regulator
MPTALKSLEKLLDYDIVTVICYHGGLVTEKTKESLQSIVRGE